ncbi:MAG TPA: hypothetical protein IAC12_02165 [Candidatus Aphodovivens avistercoris]|nr:hypothetical protein [Candidatus Aphodovivens avistercoris]
MATNETDRILADAPAAVPSRSDAAASMPSACTYLDCLKGQANTPAAAPGKAIFKVLMVGGMVTFMATINGVQHSGLEFFATAHWMYPLVFCIAFLVRTFIGDAAIGFIAPRFILPRFEGVARGIAMTLANVGVMGTVMGAIMTLLLNPPAEFFVAYFTTLPLSLACAVLVNFFIVGPAAKIAYNNIINSKMGMQFLRTAERDGMSWMAIFNS